MSIFSILIDLQSHDTAFAQLHHKRGHLPEHLEIASLSAAIASVDTGSLATRKAAETVNEKMAKIEVSVHELDAKIKAVETTLFSGTITNSRELQGFEADRESLKRRRSDLEDAELALIDELEPLEQVLARADGDVATHRANIAQLEMAVVAAQAEIDVVAARHVAERTELMGSIDNDTFALYESTRAKNRGVGAVLIEHGTCMSCKIKLPAIELDRIRNLSPDILVRCEECSVILVR